MTAVVLSPVNTHKKPNKLCFSLKLICFISISVSSMKTVNNQVGIKFQEFLNCAENKTL